MGDVQALIAAFRDDPDGPDTEATLAELIDGGFVIPDDTAVSSGVLQIDPVDADAGTIRKFYIYLNGVFKFDETDNSTAHDGITCIVLIGGKRYKVLGDIRVKAVEAVGIDDEPADPEYGQAWIDLTGVVGDSNQIVIWTSSGWRAIDPDYGPPIYVKTATTGYLAKSYVHWDEDDGWVAGVGAGAVLDASIPPTALIWWPERVVNATTNSPPSSWSKGVAYIIGSSASGDWAGNSGKLAVAFTDGVLADGDTFSIITPKTGQQVYNIALGILQKWNGSAWESAAGSVIGYKRSFSAASAFNGSGATAGGSGTYTYNATTAPNSQKYLGDDTGITYAARSTANVIEIQYQAYVNYEAEKLYTVALYRDSETNAIDWVADLRSQGVNVTFTVTPGDTSSHTYKVRMLKSADDSGPTSFGRRLLTVKEIVQS